MRTAQWALMLELCDPGPVSQPLPSVKQEDVEPLLAAAKKHGVFPVVVKRLRECGAIPDNTIFQRAQLDLAAITGQAMLLSHYAEQVSTAFNIAGVRFTIVKGPTFAAHLYPLRTDRPFTDVDVLIHAGDIDRASKVMAELGFVSNDYRPGIVFGEYKWEPIDGRKILIELHTNLMHAPKLRNSVSLSYDTLLRAGDGTAEAPAALLLVAGLHGTLGHQFERLQLLVDVLQAARYVAKHRANAAVVRACRELGAGLAVATALDLAAAAFHEPLARDLADEISCAKMRNIMGLLVTPSLVASAQDATAWRRSWRRKLYRQILSSTRERAD